MTAVSGTTPDGACQVREPVHPRPRTPLGDLARTLVESGDTAGAHAVYDEMRARTVREYVAPMILASVEAALGDTDAAIAHCREAVQQHDPFFIRFAHDSSGVHHLQSLPEYRRLAASVGLPGYAERANG